MYPQTKYVKKSGLKNLPSSEVGNNLLFCEPLYKKSQPSQFLNLFKGVSNGFYYNIFEKWPLLEGFFENQWGGGYGITGGVGL